MNRRILVTMVVLIVGTSGCSMLGSTQEISVTGTVVTGDVPDNETIRPYSSVNDEPTREAVRGAVEDHDPNEPGYDETIVRESEVNVEFEDGEGYVEYDGHIVRVNYWRLEN